MFPMSDSWLGGGITVIIGFIVIGFATGIGKSIIWLFATGHEMVKTSDGDQAAVKSEIHEVA